MTPTTAWIIGSIVAWVGMGAKTYQWSRANFHHRWRLLPWTNKERALTLCCHALPAPIAFWIVGGIRLAQMRTKHPSHEPWCSRPAKW